MDSQTDIRTERDGRMHTYLLKDIDFSRFLRKRDGPTQKRKDGRMDRAIYICENALN